jgi:hypothetical protein
VPSAKRAEKRASLGHERADTALRTTAGNRSEHARRAGRNTSRFEPVFFHRKGGRSGRGSWFGTNIQTPREVLPSCEIPAAPSVHDERGVGTLRRA